MYDVIIVGGSYAGLAAALQLARARRSVLILDAGQRRNRFAAHAHGFLGQDGQAGAAIAAKGRSEVLAYPTVTWQEARVTGVRALPGGGFALATGSGERESQRLVLATGVADELPAIPGLAERWGKTAFFCPYCDGYELGMPALAVLATGPGSLHQAAIVAEWAAQGQTTLLVNGAFEPEPDALADLARRGIQVERASVASVAGEVPEIEVRLGDGRSPTFGGLFLMPRTHFRDSFAEALGCELAMGHLGPFLKTDETMETTVPGVFACGDIARSLPGVAYAVGDGTRTGAAVHQSLVFRPLP